MGVDVGGRRKGFHAVALRDGKFETFHSTNSDKIASCCKKLEAKIVAVDAPCAWSIEGKSRKAERDLAASGIHCYATPNQNRAEENPFYDWVCNGFSLYQALQKHYALFGGKRHPGNICVETFPHAIVCALKGKIVRTRPKAEIRRDALRGSRFDIGSLTNIDYVDAALCAVTAEFFCKKLYESYGDKTEGFIVVPKLHG